MKVTISYFPGKEHMLATLMDNIISQFLTDADREEREGEKYCRIEYTTRHGKKNKKIH